MLILAQKPNATNVVGFKTWQELEKYARKGEKVIEIFARTEDLEAFLQDKNQNPVVFPNLEMDGI
ncbi:MAG TPA: hypothetical protein GX004_02855 [Firmicutes bacterium]|jgi:hypothetical protein|nr:hypothetical protein [Bacillota bacterium]